MALAPTDPPPETLTTLLNCDGAFAATFTVMVMEDWEPAFRVPAVEQIVLEQLHPVPDIDTSDSPVGIVSATVTVPLVGEPKAALLTVTV